MELIAKADVVLALGTRLNPFSTLPGYGIDYWPKAAKVIQVDINADRIGLTKPVSVAIQGDAQAGGGADPRGAGAERRRRRPRGARGAGRTGRGRPGCSSSRRWTTRTTIRARRWNERARAAHPERMSPRMAWRAIQAALPKDAIISSDIGNNCAIGNAYPTFEEGRKYLAPGLFGPCGYGLPSIIGAKIGCPDVPVVGFAGDGAFGIAMNEMTASGREEWPAITMVVFRNYQWGAEKRNSTLWFDDNFVGTELDLEVNYAAIARGLRPRRACRRRRWRS